ncbi:MAG: hypothetical protein OXI61_16070 [Candidatus Poribacteria bacterium]|nr:hypothetical protein [Candidatus Poribacteria bacterium]
MSRLKTDYMFSTGASGTDSEKARKAIEAVREAVRVSSRSHTSEVEKAKAAYLKALHEAVKRFSRSKQR